MSTGEVVAWVAIVLLSIAGVVAIFLLVTRGDSRAQDPCTDTPLAILELKCPHPDHKLVTEGRGFCVCDP